MSSEVSNPRHPPDLTPAASVPAVAPSAAKKKRRLIALAVAVVALGGGVALWAARGSSSAQAAHAPRELPDTPRVEGERITFSKSFVERAKLKFAPVTRASLVPIVTAVGTVAFNPTHVAAVGARLRGLVSRVAKFEGDTVESGTVLAVIESGELGEAQAAVSMLEAEKRATEVNYQREKALAQKNLTTQREAEVAAVDAERSQLMLRAAKQKVAALSGGVGSRSSGRLGAHELRSPMKGTIVERHISPGQSVEGQLVAFRIADIDHLWVELDVFERSLGQVRVGDEAELKPMAAASKALIGHVAKIASEIDPETRSAKVRVEVENREHQWRVGQAVKATIHSSGGPAALRTTVRTEAITFVDGKPTVFVMSGPNAVRVVNVHLGAHDDHSTEVLDGIAPSDRVVTDGAFALKGELFR